MTPLNDLTDPTDPIAAVTHANPYPYYRDLLARAPLWRDERLGLWVAARAATVDEVLQHAALRVRPSAEPVPKALVESVAGDIFGRLVRMNDGAGHCPFKQILATRLAAIQDDDVRTASLNTAEMLIARHRPAAESAGLNEFMFALPARVIAHLIGVPGDRLDDVEGWTRDFVGGLSPVADAPAIADGKRAAEKLYDLFDSLLQSGASHYLNSLTQGMKAAGKRHADIAVANGIGLLSQTYEATAGLIGNTLIALGQHPAVLHEATGDWQAVRSAVAEVVRHDPPVQNTRRFAAAELQIAGETVSAGDAILVVLAAANRDATANPVPDRFDPYRQGRRSWTFGAGVHACPGENLAVTMAATAVERLLAAGVDASGLIGNVTYRRSGNARLPQFFAG